MVLELFLTNTCVLPSFRTLQFSLALRAPVNYTAILAERTVFGFLLNMPSLLLSHSVCCSKYNPIQLKYCVLVTKIQVRQGTSQ